MTEKDSENCSCETLKQENLELKELVKTLEDRIEELKVHTIETYDKSKKLYTTPFREMCYELLKEHVGLSHIGPVITHWHITSGYQSKPARMLLFFMIIIKQMPLPMFCSVCEPFLKIGIEGPHKMMITQF